MTPCSPCPPIPRRAHRWRHVRCVVGHVLHHARRHPLPVFAACCGGAAWLAHPAPVAAPAAPVAAVPVAPMAAPWPGEVAGHGYAGPGGAPVTDVGAIGPQPIGYEAPPSFVVAWAPPPASTSLVPAAPWAPASLGTPPTPAPEPGAAWLLPLPLGLLAGKRLRGGGARGD